MDVTAAALDTLTRSATEHEARLVGDLVELRKLGLYVRIRPSRADEAGPLFIAEFDASTHPTRRGIIVTCVGLGADGATAARDAVAQWALGVLPVLAQWRGEHSCLVSDGAFTGPASQTYDALKGPVVERGEHDAGDPPNVSVDGYLSLLTEPLRAAKLAPQPHWLECFAIRTADGSIDATCRLDNRDWAPGQKLLAADASGWSGTTSSYHSRRQFVLLTPQGSGDAGLPAPPSFWARLFGRG